MKKQVALYKDNHNNKKIDDESANDEDILKSRILVEPRKPPEMSTNCALRAISVSRLVSRILAIPRHTLIAGVVCKNLWWWTGMAQGAQNALCVFCHVCYIA